MSTQLSNIGLKVLVVLRTDAQRLFERIKYRQAEYLHHFSSKRTREHFSQIFWNRYQGATLSDLKELSEEILSGFDTFYSKVDDLKWYLSITEDMPAKVHDIVVHSVHEIEEAYNLLQFYIGVDLGTIDKETQADDED